MSDEANEPKLSNEDRVTAINWLKLGYSPQWIADCLLADVEQIKPLKKQKIRGGEFNYVPTPDEIQEATRQIRSQWSKFEERRRLQGEYEPPPYTVPTVDVDERDFDHTAA